MRLIPRNDNTRIKRTDSQKLQDEYAKLVAGLQEQDDAREEEAWMTNPGRFRTVPSQRDKFADYMRLCTSAQRCRMTSSKRPSLATYEGRSTSLPSWQDSSST